MVLGKLSVPGCPAGLSSGQGPTTFVVGAGGVVWTFCSRLSLLFFLPVL